MRNNTIALLVSHPSEPPALLGILLDDREIKFLEGSLLSGDLDPLIQIDSFRSETFKRESEFANYLEDLLSQPFQSFHVKQQGIAWFKSKIKVERFQVVEQEAAQVIAEFAYQIFLKDPEKIDFFLASSKNRVRIRIFILKGNQLRARPKTKFGQSAFKKSRA